MLHVDCDHLAKNFKVKRMEDKLLIWKFKRGSTDALCRIYDKYKVHLLNISTALLNDKSVAEDVVHSLQE